MAGPEGVIFKTIGAINKFMGIPDYNQCVDRFLKACDNQTISKTERIVRAKKAFTDIGRKIAAIEIMQRSTGMFCPPVKQELNTLKWQEAALMMYINGMSLQAIKKNLTVNS